MQPETHMNVSLLEKKKRAAVAILTGFEAGLEDLLHDDLVGRVQGVLHQLGEATACVPEVAGDRALWV